MGSDNQWDAMTIDDFPEAVRAIIEPSLVDLGFELDNVDTDVAEGGPQGSVVYYRSNDCRMQVYLSSREGSINCMIAPLSAPNTFGPQDRSGVWQYLGRFVPRDQRVNDESIDPKGPAHQLEWVRARIADYYPAAHAGILEMFGNG